MPAKSSIGTDAVQLTTTDTPVRYRLIVRADPSNTGVVYLGLSSGVTANTADTTDGIPLRAGESIVLPNVLVDNATDVYLIGSAASQKVFWFVDLAEEMEPVATNTPTSTLGSGSNRVGGTYEVSGQVIDENGTVLTVKRAVIAASTSGDNSLVALVASKKIRVLSLFVLAGAAGNIYFTSNTGGTVIFGGSTNKINLPANGGFTLQHNPHGWMETAAGQALIMNASSTGPFSGGLTYIEVA